MADRDLLSLDHAVNVYPWDVLDDPSAAERIAALGVPAVSLAASYHTVRAMTPHNPRRAVVHAHHAATYFTPEPSRYAGTRLQPLPATWVEPDAYATAQERLRAAGLRVHAWTVLLHATIQGVAHLDLTVENAFGDRYPYALCPAHPESRAYAAALVGEVTERLRPDAIELEAWGYMGIAHGSHHDKTGVALDPFHQHLLSLCFNPASQQAIDDAGGDPDRIRDRVREKLRASCRGEAASADADRRRASDPDVIAERLEELLGPADADALSAAREAVELSLLDGLLAAMPADRLPVYVHATPSPYDTGSSVGVRPDTLDGRVDGAILVLFGQSADAGGALVSRFVAHAGSVRTVATVPLFGPGGEGHAELTALAAAARDAGAAGVRYYHWGLAPPDRHGWVTELVGVTSAGRTRPGEDQA